MIGFESSAIGVFRVSGELLGNVDKGPEKIQLLKGGGDGTVVLRLLLMLTRCESVWGG